MSKSKMLNEGKLILSCCKQRLFLILSFLLVVSAIKAAQAKEFVVCHELQPFPPYFTTTNKNANKEVPGVVGVLPDILTQAILAAGVKPKFVGFPWKRCLELLKQNKIEATFPSIYLEKREVIGRYPMVDGAEDKSRSLAKVIYSIFTHRDNPVPWDGAFLGEVTPVIGAPLGYVVVQSLMQKHNIKADTRFLAIRGLQLVALGRLNGYVVEKLGGERLLRLERLEEKVVAIEPPFEKRYWHLMISHKFYSEFPELAENIWDQVKIQRTKNFSKLVKKHSGHLLYK